MRVICDCDNTMGLPMKEVDDGLTLLYLLGRPDVELLGVTTTFGNGDIEEVYSQTERLLDDLEYGDIPLFKGEKERGQPPTEAARFLADTAAAHPGEIALLATGPLGNLRAAAELGITKVRLTGGEPLVRLGVVDLVRMLSRIPGVDDLSMTTNGILLPRYAADLAEAGLRRVNVSLDTLRPERFHHITRLGRFEDVLTGMEAAQAAGLEPIKINTVVIRGMNDDEVVDLAQKTAELAWNVRFIELMPVGNGMLTDGGWRERVVTAKEIRRQIELSLGALEPAKMSAGSGPARYYRLPGANGTLGFITPISEHFCYQCNRLRLTADGQLRPCLLSDDEIDLRTRACPLKRWFIIFCRCEYARNQL